MRRRTFVVLALLATAFTAVPAGAAQTDGRAIEREIPASVQEHALGAPFTTNAKVADRDLIGSEGRVELSIRLTTPSAALGGSSASVSAEQESFLVDLQAIDPTARVIGSVQQVLNAVFVEVDGAAIEAIVDHVAVTRISRVAHYEHDLADTVPYIGGTRVQQEFGFDGSGVTVAVLDSGIDYTHANLGGGGTLADYEAAFGDTDPSSTNFGDLSDSRDGLFPTAKVIDGADYVGELWPFGPQTFDDDPIDYDGHGTHVADIIAGENGVAPGASLIGIKVCASLSPSCNGIALILGMEFAVGAGADIINMSLGSIYGQAFDDDLAAAVEGASALGVLTVASAGNSADKPYVTGTPAATPSALSVAQTEVPSAVEIPMEIIEPEEFAGFYTAVFQPWSEPQTSAITGEVIYGNGAGGNLLGCDEFTTDLTGEIVAVDRGDCAFSQKIQNIEAAGGILGIIITVGGAAPFPGGFGGGDLPGIPAYMIEDSDGDPLRAGGAIVSFDPANGTPLVGTMVSSSSRGPSMLSNLVKPEIGAPGASISAEVGTGTGETPFGGTSGAAPMVSGSAALLLDASPGLSPAETKARLINTADPDIRTTVGSALAPISRIGGGEVRVDRAVAAGAAAWETSTGQGALSFGAIDATSNNTVAQKSVTVRNYTNQRITYDVDASFRYADDAASGALKITTPNRVVVQPKSTATFVVTAQVRGENLPDWPMNSGSLGNSPDALNAAEFDGYVTLTDSRNTDNNIHLPWHALPRKSGDVTVQQTGQTYKVRNGGVGTTTVEAYSLVAKSPDLPEGGFGEQSPTPDLRYVGYATFPVPAGFCSANPSFVMAFAVNTWERQTHANAPAFFEFDLDTDQDGVFDYAVFNVDLSFFSPSFNLSDGRNVVAVQDLATNQVSAFFFTDHETNSGNTVLYICGEQIGMDATNFFQPMDVVAFAGDLYFGGPGDATDVFTISPLGEQYLGVFEDGGVGVTTLDARSADTLEIIDFGPLTNDTETGLLLLHRGGADASNEASIIEP